MTLKSRTGIPAALILVGVLLVGPDADAQVQDRSQQTCINAYQKAAAKLLKTQAVETFRCANFALKGKIANARECIESDLRGKLAKSQAWASVYLSKKCPDLPDYGIATPGDLWEAGRSTPLQLLEDVFGPAISAQLSAPPKAEGLCMRSIIKAYDRLLHANAKTFAQCLKTQLRAGQLTAADPLAEACLAAIEIDARGLREKFTAILDATAVQRCGDFLDPSIFAGECSTSSNAADLTECIASRTDCRSCQLLNESTDSSLDCDVFDNGLADDSCTKRLNPCGDGVLDPGEECDEGAENSDLLPDACRTNCQSARCGDGVVDGGEACDDGDLNQEYAPGTCRTTCVEPTCGAGEACDDGNSLDSDFCSNLCQQQNWSAPLLLLVVDFNDTDVNADLPDAEDRWSSLMFGAGNAEGNHYWEEQFGGRFDLQPAQESAGTPNNGVIVAQVTAAAPTGTDRYLVEAENWVPEALDYAASHLDFDSYDTDANGVLENHELAVLVVLNTSWGNLSGAGAQANIPIHHPIAGTGVTLTRFARSLHRYGSIGVNLHELGHHVFDLDHFAPPGSHGLMSTGAYGENPAIPVLWGTLGNWGTRPTLMIAFSHMRTGATSPTTPDWSGSTATLELNSVDSGNYNVVRLPIADGYLLVENRQSVGYDASIPFCDGDQGGIFITEVANYIRPLDVANLESRRTSVSYNDAFDLCDAYSLSGRNDSFSYAGYDFSNFSAAGATMTVDVAQNAIERSLDAFKWRWFKKDPEREGYRLWHHAEALVGTPTTIDFAEIPGGDNPGATFPLVLFGYYDSGEMRSLNRPASWTVSTGAPYVTLSKSDVTGGTGTTGTTAIVSISFAEGETCATEALLEAELEETQRSDVIPPWPLAKLASSMF